MGTLEVGVTLAKQGPTAQPKPSHEEVRRHREGEPVVHSHGEAGVGTGTGGRVSSRRGCTRGTGGQSTVGQ